MRWKSVLVKSCVINFWDIFIPFTLPELKNIVIQTRFEVRKGDELCCVSTQVPLLVIQLSSSDVCVLCGLFLLSQQLWFWPVQWLDMQCEPDLPLSSRNLFLAPEIIVLSSVCEHSGMAGLKMSWRKNKMVVYKRIWTFAKSRSL